MTIIDYIGLILGLLGAFLLLGIALAIPAGKFNGWVSMAWAAASSAAIIWALNILGAFA